jgi:hypothetical protein
VCRNGRRGRTRLGHWNYRTRGSRDDGGAPFAGIAPSHARGADKAYDVDEFVNDLRDLNVTPLIAQNTTNRTSAIDVRTTRHRGYVISRPGWRHLQQQPVGCDAQAAAFHPGQNGRAPSRPTLIADAA